MLAEALETFVASVRDGAEASPAELPGVPGVRVRSRREAAATVEDAVTIDEWDGELFQLASQSLAQRSRSLLLLLAFRASVWDGFVGLYRLSFEI